MPVDLQLFVDETYVSVIEAVRFIIFGAFCGSRRLVFRVVRLFRWLRWFRLGCSGSFGGSGSLNSFRRFRFSVSGFSTC